MGEQLFWNDIISFNSIGNQRKQWYQLHGIGCNWCTSSIGGAIDLEWNYLIECNWELKEQMVSVTWNRMQLMEFINWGSYWSGMTLWIKNMNKKIIDKMFKLKSLGNQMNHFYRMGSNLSGKELLMWNDIQAHFYLDFK